MIYTDKDKIKFFPQADFQKFLKSNVEQYFRQNNLSRYGNPTLWFKSAFLVFLTAGIYVLIMLGNLSLSALLGLCILLGIFKGSIGFIICHDALHGSFSPIPWVNRMCGYLFDLMGMSSAIWKITHNYNHHIFTNITGKDHDIDKAILLRFSPYDPHYPFHRYQHYYMFLLYAFTGLSWIFYGDYRFLISERKQLSFNDIVLTLAFKLLNLGIFLGIPFMILPLPWWQILIGYLFTVMSGGFYIAVVFQLAHLVEQVSFPLPNETGVIAQPWAVHELFTTSNFATSSKWITSLLGGLNFQIEHHLFAHISHVHYPALAPIIRQAARDFQLPYFEQETVWKAVKSHIRTVKALGNSSVSDCYSRFAKSL